MSAQEEPIELDEAGKQSNNEEKNFLFDLRFMILVLQTGGLLPSYVQHSKYNLGQSIWWKSLLSHFSRFLLYGLSVINFCVFYMAHFMSPVDGVFSIFLKMYFLATQCCCFYICGRNSVKLIEILNMLLAIDEELNRFYNFSIVHKCKRLKKITVIFFILRLYSTYELTMKYVNGYVLVLTIQVYSIFSITHIIFVSCLLDIIAKRFAFLNVILYSYAVYCQQPDISSISTMSTNNFTEDVLFVFRLHNKLMKVFKAFNEYCSLVLVMWMGYVFADITLLLHELLSEIVSKEFINTYHLFVYLISIIIALVLLCFRGERISNEANNTVRVLSKVYRQKKEDKLLMNKFLTKNIKQKVKFMAYGFYVINKATLFKIFSAVTTYFVILIQFKQLEEVHRSIASDSQRY